MVFDRMSNLHNILCVEAIFDFPTCIYVSYLSLAFVFNILLEEELEEKENSL